VGCGLCVVGCKVVKVSLIAGSYLSQLGFMSWIPTFVGKTSSANFQEGNLKRAFCLAPVGMASCHCEVAAQARNDRYNGQREVVS
jgi:hypothetical protein